MNSLNTKPQVTHCFFYFQWMLLLLGFVTAIQLCLSMVFSVSMNAPLIDLKCALSLCVSYFFPHQCFGWNIYSLFCCNSVEPCWFCIFFSGQHWLEILTIGIRTQMLWPRYALFAFLMHYHMLWMWSFFSLSWHWWIRIALSNLSEGMRMLRVLQIFSCCKENDSVYHIICFVSVLPSRYVMCSFFMFLRTVVFNAEKIEAKLLSNWSLLLDDM